MNRASLQKFIPFFPKPKSYISPLLSVINIPKINIDGVITQIIINDDSFINSSLDFI
jgi:hypothetical protein